MFLAALLLVKNYGAVPTALLAHGVIPHLPGQCRTNLMGAIAGVDATDALIVFCRLAGWKPSITISPRHALISKRLPPPPMLAIWSRQAFYRSWMTALAAPRR